MTSDLQDSACTQAASISGHVFIDALRCRQSGTDWWSVTVPTPEDGYDFNWIFTDGEGTTDNNMGQDYYLQVMQCFSSLFLCSAYTTRYGWDGTPA